MITRPKPRKSGRSSMTQSTTLPPSPAAPHHWSVRAGRLDEEIDWTRLELVYGKDHQHSSGEDAPLKDRRRSRRGSRSHHRQGRETHGEARSADGAEAHQEVGTAARQ